MSKPPLSVVIPAYNEAGNIAGVVREAVEALSPHVELDLIVVDDHSDDATPYDLEAAAKDIPELTIIRHPKRSGKSAALRTGMLAAKHMWAATMDGDGQNDPNDVLNMTRGVDLTRIDDIGLVAGLRRSRNDGESRRIASRIANGLRKQLLNDDCPDTACGLKLIPREVFLALPFFDALHRYLPALVKHLGYETRMVRVNDRPRGAGVSKYSNIGRAFAGLFDLLGVIWLMRRSAIPSKDLLFRQASED